MKITIPDSLADITLNQYQRYQKEIENSKSRPDQSEYLNIKKIEIFCNLTHDEVYNIQLGEIYDISDRIELILEEQPNLIQKFEINKIKFGWIPELDKLSYGEFLDLNGNISDWETMHIAMGVLYRPIKNEIANGLYNVEKYKGDKYHKILKEMPMDVVIGSMVFFWNLGLDCVNYITKSLEVEQKFQKQLNLVDNGIGIRHSMNSLEGILQSLKISQN